MEITKEQFITAYNKHLPSKWVVFVFKYFSKSTVENDMWLRKIFIGLLTTSFILGFVGTVLKMNSVVIGIPTFVFIIILGILGFIIGNGFILNNLRVRKIIKELGGISKYEYNRLSKKYLGNYP